MTKILFIVKIKEDYSEKEHKHVSLSTGLHNSASFMVSMLNDIGIESKFVIVKDNNGIDKEVYNYKPSHVIIEALWVHPTKFSVLCKLHPTVKWVIRLHSEIPFLASEGIAIDWIGDYLGFKNVIIGVNSHKAFREIKEFAKICKYWGDPLVERQVVYLPNFYPQEYKVKDLSYIEEKETIDVACFGAVRPLKNHLLQAMAAIEFANRINKKLRFHINSGRIEMKGEPVVHNLQGLFFHTYEAGHILINHEWSPRTEFLDLCAKMDIGLQVSFSETFNIVGADIISQGVPLVGSNEIPWSCKLYNATPIDSQSIVAKLILAYEHGSSNVHSNQAALTEYTNTTIDIWKKYFLDK